MAQSQRKNAGRARRPKNTVQTKSGNSIKINQSITDRYKARKAARQAAKAEYLATLPKDRWKRLAYRMHPKRVAQYWFSREGGIMALKLIGAAIVVCFFLTIGLFAYFRKDLPQIKDISGDNLGGSITYYDRTGKIVLFQDYNAVKRIPVQSNQISKYMKDATVAIEDKNFYKEGAFSIRGIVRAASHDLIGGGGSVQGGSTITQQLVKLNENWTDNRTITRKVKELILAVELEREYSKSDILTGYLNIAPYGGVEYGVESAAEDYFQTSAQNLTLPQAAMLAAIPQSPSYYSPYGSTQFNPDAGNTFSASALLNRQHYILDQMVLQGYITKAQADAAKKVDILSEVHAQQPKYQNIKAPYFVMAAKQQLEQQFGSSTVQRGGWNVITTVDMNAQNEADQLVANNIKNVDYRSGGKADEQAVVAEDVQTGQVVALVGGEDFNNPTYGNLNFGATELVSPGSTFKPYDYATFINNNNNVGAGSVLYDAQGPIPGYPCTVKGLPPPQGNGNCLEDYDFIYPGPITLRYALGGSRNVPAVKAMLSAVPNDKSNGKVDSINKVISTASAMMDNPYDQAKHQSTYNCYDSQENKTQCYGASAIGDGVLLLDDQLNGLATLGRLGKAIPRTFILKITDASNKTVYQWKQPAGTQVIKQDSAYIVDNMASDPRASYLPGSCTATNCTELYQGGYKFHRYQGWDFAIKTGTNNDGFEGLMASWSTKYAVISWVGNHTRNVDLNNTTMEYMTEPLTRGLMEDLHNGLKPVNWTQPSDIKVAPAFVVRNHIHYGDQEPSPTDDLYPSWYAGGTNSKNTSETIDRVSGKLATSCTPAAAKEVVGNSNVAYWNADIFMGGQNSIGTNTSGVSSGTSATDDVHNCNDSPPTITLTAPSNCDTTCTITATVTQGTHPLSDPQYPSYPGTVTFTLDGKTINTSNVSSSPSTVSFTYTPSSSGSGTLAATVTDSVLYSGTDSTTLNYTAPSLLSLASATANGSTVTFTWTGGGGTVGIYNSNGDTQLCSASASTGTCQTSTALAPSGTPVYAKDDQGDKSSTTNVSGT